MNNIIIKTDLIITLGKGCSKGCGISVYTLPFSGTKEVTIKYFEKAIKEYQDDQQKGDDTWDR